MNWSPLRGLPVAALVACLLVGASAAPAAAAVTSPDLAAPPAGVDEAPRRGFFRWPTAGRLTQGFGCTGERTNARRRGCFFHNGLDIANRRGTPIRAAAAGVVRYVGWDPYDRSRDRAWLVIIKHRRGVSTWYAHLLPRRVARAKVGDRVRRGQVIGYMGKTGKATGVHLHFMARVKGEFVNPYRFLPAGSRRPPKPRRAGSAAMIGVAEGRGPV